MTISQIIKVNGHVDVITARMRVREEARRLGLNLTEQSQISLATSSLAGALRLGLDSTVLGQISIEDMQNGNRKGVKVVCIRNNFDGFTPPLSYFGNERWMVDEFEMRILPSDQVEITMTKWAGICS